jgi:hypothetical protein
MMLSFMALGRRKGQTWYVAGSRMKATRPVSMLRLGMVLLAIGCGSASGYETAAELSRNGFARDRLALRQIEGEVITVSGFVDHGNLYGDESARARLGAWWGGAGPNSSHWRFHLKAHSDDAIGQSFAVHVVNDTGRDALLTAFVVDAQAGQPTLVCVSGRLIVFDAALNNHTLTGLRLEVSSARAVRLGSCERIESEPQS